MNFLESACEPMYPKMNQQLRSRLTVVHVATGVISGYELGEAGARIGRDPKNEVLLPDPRVGRRQGVLNWRQGELVYEHLRSVHCPSLLLRGEQVIAVDERVGYRVVLKDGDQLMFGQAPSVALIRVHTGAQDAANDADAAEQFHLEKSIDMTAGSIPRTIDGLSRDELATLQRFVARAAGASDVGHVVHAFASSVFGAYSAANHLSVFLIARPDCEFEPFLTFDRDGPVLMEPLSRSIAAMLRESDQAFLFHAGDTKVRASESLQLARVRAGMCAPLQIRGTTFGVVQLDRRGKLGGGFHGRDLELLAVFAHQLAAFIESRGTVGKLRLEVAHLRRGRSEMANLAYSDSLTGLPNRRLFLDRLEQALARTNRGGAGFTFLYADLDRLKAINDRHGHEAGDRALQAVAGRLRGCLREADTVARLGGDEFAMILDGVDCPQTAAAVVDKIHDKFKAPIGSAADTGPARLQVGISVGVAIAPRDGNTVAALMEFADAQMYRDKSTASKAR